MTDGPTAPNRPDPPGQNASKEASANGNDGSGRPSPNEASNPFNPPPSQTPGRPTVSGLAAFEAGKRRKRQATAGPDERPRRADHAHLGTPRSVRFKKLFADNPKTPGILDVAKKLHDIIEGAIKLPKKGAEKITIGSESAADIKTLAAHVLDLAEALSDFPFPSIRRNPFSETEEDHQIERSLAGTNAFGCKVPDTIASKLDQLAKDLAEMKNAVTMPTGQFTFTNNVSNPKTPSYALAASKHAPRQPTTTTPTTFRPVLTRKQPPPPPPAIKPVNTLTLSQADKDGLELANLNYPSLISFINTKLTAANVKVNATDEKAIQIRSVHRHPSNDIVLYTTTPQQAEALRNKSEVWLPTISSKLTVHSPVHSIVVHGIPATFIPTDPKHIEMLVAMNPDTLNPAPVFIKWLSPNAIHRGVSHSSIRIGFAEGQQAKKAVDQMIFYGRYNKKTEFGRKTKPRCMNCLKEGHTSTFCKESMMCPYCAEAHPADKCEFKGMMTSNCTACAQRKKTADPTVDLKQLFSNTPKELRHSPLDPTCPARVAEKVARVNEPQSTQAALTRPDPAVSAQEASTAAAAEVARPCQGQATAAAGTDEHMLEEVL